MARHKRSYLRRYGAKKGERLTCNPDEDLGRRQKWQADRKECGKVFLISVALPASFLKHARQFLVLPTAKAAVSGQLISAGATRLCLQQEAVLPLHASSRKRENYEFSLRAVG